jgi:hypothetical protein
MTNTKRRVIIRGGRDGIRAHKREKEFLGARTEEAGGGGPRPPRPAAHRGVVDEGSFNEGRVSLEIK